MQNNQPLTPAEALQELQRILQEDTDTIPKGWHTAQDLADAWGLSLERASVMLRRSVAKGICERRKFRIKPNSICKPVWHYFVSAQPAAQEPVKQ